MAYGGPPTSFAPVSLPPEIVAKCLSARWTGSLSVPRTGEYSLYVADAVGEAKLWIDDRLVVDSWSPFLRATDVARLRLESGRRHAFRLEWKRADAESTLAFAWLPPREGRPPISLWSASAEGIDYVFVRGDDARRGDRRLPRADGARRAAAALGPRLLAEPRALQDGERARGHGEGVPRATLPARRDRAGLEYWPKGAWGSHELDPTRFPEPKATTDAIHALGAKMMISVWPKYTPGTPNFDELQKAGHLYPLNLATQTKDWLGNVFTNYDAFDPEARRIYWRQVERALFSKGIDAFWLDVTEPEVLQNQGPADLATRMSPTAIGPGARVLNAYPLMASRAVFEGQRRAAPERRVAILTRSAWAGSQRYEATVWSGDVVARWSALRAQIPAGLSYSLSGMPWWTTDIGGFNMDDPAGPRVGGLPGALHALVPVRRVLPRLPLHGTDTAREPWLFGLSPAAGAGRDGPPGLKSLLLSPTALPAAALPLHARLAGHPRARHDDAGPRPRLSGRPEGPRRAGPVPVRPGAPRQPGHRAGRATRAVYLPGARGTTSGRASDRRREDDRRPGRTS